MEKLHTPDNNEKLQEAWKKLSNTVLDYTFSILRSHAYVDHTDEINSVYALIPIITYIYLKPDHKLNEEEIKKVIKWFYYSQIRTRYTGQMQQKLDKDLKVVEESESPFDELLKIIEEDRSLERSEEHTSELQSRGHLVCRLLLEKKKKKKTHFFSQLEQ